MSGARSPADVQLERIRALAQEHHSYRSSRLNLGCAESMTSGLVREMLARDFGRRYGTKGGYSGGRYLDEIEAIGERIARRLFGCEYAILSPITGHVAMEAVLLALTTPGDRVMTLAPNDGGYPTGIATRLGLEVVHHAFNADAFNLNVDECNALILAQKPNVVVFGSARYLFAHPVGDVAPACREVGATMIYDASHPFGLIAGHTFDDPFRFGVDVMFGSTSKTLFGPTRGLILVRDRADVRDRIESVFANFLVQSTYQLNSLVALCVSLAESLAFGPEFARRVIENARALAVALDGLGVGIIGSRLGYTDSQLVLPEISRNPRKFREGMQLRLERAGILADHYLRFGTQQVTRLGMGPDEMTEIAGLISEVLESTEDDYRSLATVEAQVDSLAARFQSLRYTFSPVEDPFCVINSAEV